MDRRNIIHIDMDAFYASVEQRDQPEYKGKPLVVGGSPNHRGVVAAASYEARAFGIHSAMPSAKAVRLCPEAIFVHPRFPVYKQVSAQIRAIFHEVTDLVEPLSLDEAYLDVSQNHWQWEDPLAIAERIRAKIRKETQLTASAGVAPNKFLAKMASDMNKPNGIYVIRPEEATLFVETLPIGKFHGIGKATESRMHSLGIQTGFDLKQFSEAELVRHFGKSGHFYYQVARGYDPRRVQPNRVRKSVSVEETFGEDLKTLDQGLEELLLLAKNLSQRLEKAGVKGRTVTLKLRYENFESITRSHSLEKYVDQADSLQEEGRKLLSLTEFPARPIRLMGLGLSNLDNQEETSTEGQQMLLPLEWQDGDDYGPELEGH